MFLMYTVTYGGRSLLAERSQGTLPRLLISPTATAQVLGGKVLGIFFTGVAQVGILILASAIHGDAGLVEAAFDLARRTTMDVKILGVPRKLVVACLMGISLFLLLRKGVLLHLLLTIVLGVFSYSSYQESEQLATLILYF